MDGVQGDKKNRRLKKNRKKAAYAKGKNTKYFYNRVEFVADKYDC